MIPLTLVVLMAPAPRTDVSPKPQTKSLSYADARAIAIKDGMPLVVWVNFPAPTPVPGAVVCTESWAIKFRKVNGWQGAIVFVPDGNGDLSRIADLDGIPTVAEIAQAIALSRDAFPVRPFSKEVLR